MLSKMQRTYISSGYVLRITIQVLCELLKEQFSAKNPLQIKKKAKDKLCLVSNYFLG